MKTAVPEKVSNQLLSKTVLGRLFFYLLLWLLGVATCKEWLAVWLTLPTFAVLIWGIFQIKTRYFCVEDAFWFCIMMFFVVSPCQALSKGYLDSLGPASNRVFYHNGEIAQASAVVFLTVAGFAIGKKLVSTLIKKTPAGTRRRPRLSQDSGLYLAIAGAVSFVIYIYLAGGISNVLAPRREKEAINLGAYLFLAILVVTAMLNSALTYRVFKSASPLLYKIWAGKYAAFLMLLLAVCVNPLNTPRFILIASWFPLLLTLVGGRIRYQFIYIFMVFGLIVVMPLMSVTSRLGTSGLADFSLGESSEIFHVKEVDVFDTLVHSVHMKQKNGLAWGDNTLADVLFFVPRNLWENKPLVGGLVVGNDLKDNYGAGTSNLSFYSGGDLYMDFGMAGAFFGFIVVGAIWERFVSSRSYFLGQSLFQAALMGSIPILVRGPLGAVAGYFCAVIIVIFCFSLFAKDAYLTRRKQVKRVSFA